MLCPTCRDGAVPVGCRRAGRGGRGRRGPSQVYQPYRRLDQDGTQVGSWGFWQLWGLTCEQIEALPTRSNDEQPLQNILSISTAGRNRYLLHFNSHHSLVQWTSGIRLALFEHSTLQEAYTGALIAGKGKTLNNIGVIMERARLPVQEWVRVRFGAGVPWKRCFCVIEPPSEKDVQKAQKEQKKRSAYDRSHGLTLKGEIRFYESKKEADKKKKNSRPIATITDAYSAYAIYPEAKELIDGSTLLKVEGQITIHSDPPSASEGFVFILPEVPAAVSGFEMLLRFLFPTWDVFCLYGRPGRLVASTLDSRSLMFGMPQDSRYGYLEILDINPLVQTAGSKEWSERDWRKKMKELTGQRMADDSDRGHSRTPSHSSRRMSVGPQTQAAPPRARVGFADGNASNPSDSSPHDPNRNRRPGQAPMFEGSGNFPVRTQERFANDLASTPERSSSEDGSRMGGVPLGGIGRRMETPEPVNPPPAFAHERGGRPQQANHSPDLRKATSRLSNTTLGQIATAGGFAPDAFGHGGADRSGNDQSGRMPPQTDQRSPVVQTHASADYMGMNANANSSREALTSPTSSGSGRPSPRLPPPGSDPSHRSRSPLAAPPPRGGPYQGGPQQYRLGPHMGPPQHGRGTPPMMSPQGPPDGRGYPQGAPRDPRMGPPQGHPQGPPYGPPGSHQQYQQRNMPPPGPRRTPPPSQSMPRPPHMQGGSPPVNRKPLPQRTTSMQPQGDDKPPQVPAHDVPRHSTDRSVDGNRQDDASSTTSPDYASTRPSTDTHRSEDRPRAGVLKTIGDELPPSAGQSSTGSTEYVVPDVNFGPTINYGASKKVEAGHAPSGRASPGPGPAFSHFRQESNDTIKRTAAWQPGGVSAGPSSADLPALSPEQFVQQRAAMATNPGFVHQRTPSSNTLTDHRAPTPGSPFKRPGSRNHSRNNSSSDLLQAGRPVSSGAMSSYLSAREQEHVARVTGSPLIALNTAKHAPSPSQGLIGAIDTREKERAQMKAGYSSQTVAQAIDQRQRDQNQQAQRAAQAAYAQQQQQQAQQQAQFAAQQQQQQAQFAPQQRYMGDPPQGNQRYAHQQVQQAPGPGSRPQMMPQQGSFSNGAPGPQQGYPQGGGGGWPGNVPHRPPQHQQQQPGQSQSPGFQAPPQGQYTPPGPRPGTPGRAPFQGQAF